MGKNLFEKIISSHFVSGSVQPGSEVGIRIDQTLTQDSLGAMAYLQFESLGVEKVKTELSVSYVDHLMFQPGSENADVHRYLESVADKYGIVFSKPGNGICHQVHLERFSQPGKTLIGGDSHTVTCGAAGMLAIGVGGLDVALAMGGAPLYILSPKVIKVNLIGSIKEWSSAKDIILEILKLLTSKGNVGTALEYTGPGIQNLTVPERATICNMGAELGVTTSIFPSDEMTKRFFIAQGREKDWQELLADPDATYAKEITIDLSQIEPNIALPHSPDHVCTVKEMEGKPVNQVLIGSCTNSSYQDLMTVAAMLKGRKIHPSVSLGIVPGSRQVLSMITQSGALYDIIASGARILEAGCGFCVGQGQAPQTGGVSVRTNNRNFEGRSGTKDAQVFLVSPATAAATALSGKITDPRDLLLNYPQICLPEKYDIDDSMILYPSNTAEIFRSAAIGTPPFNTPMPTELKSRVAIKVSDMINTDDIIPGGSAMNYRSNIPKSCEFIFKFIDPLFPQYCKENKEAGVASVIVAGISYGQGSSREHAALCPMYMGVRVVAAKSFERIHRDNLINFGILPLVFVNDEDYERIEKDDELFIDDIYNVIHEPRIQVSNLTKNYSFTTVNNLTMRQCEIILAGGKLNHATQK
ncbi:aconitate hydratase [Sporomusa aerivorans]|uniref:aconitate hydratase n=1 Tax=Sporomusa aerivorans TaxID=204936 RepID=UPI00352B1B78